MTLQYILIGIVLAVAIAYAARRIYRTIKQNLICKNYRCAGCAFYDQCQKKKKKGKEKFGWEK